jgi:hypothetical protein
MLINDWYPGNDSARYFTLAFRFNVISATLTDESPVASWRSCITETQVPLLSRSRGCMTRAAIISGIVRWDTNSEVESVDSINISYVPASRDVWARMLFLIDPGRGWDQSGCELCPGDDGLAKVWMMNAQTGEWEPWKNEDEDEVEYRGPLGHRYITPEGKPRPYRRVEDNMLRYQWKVGHYASEVGWIILDYDNVAYGKRWNNITKNRLIGHHKSVLSLKLDEGQGTVVNDSCWSWNGGQQGDVTMDYNNDGVLQSNVVWSTDGIGFYRRSLRFGGGYVSVPVDTTDFDFGNYVTVSAWFKTTADATTPQGWFPSTTTTASASVPARRNDRLSFGVRHADGTYSNLIHDHEPGLYADGRWHHVAGTFNRFTDDNRRVKLYIDGQRVLQREGKISPSFAATRGPRRQARRQRPLSATSTR